MFAVVLLAATVTVKAPPPVRALACDPNHFLTKAYQDLLGRPIDAAGSAYWLGLMKNGASRVQVASEMMRSNEYKSAVVRDLYNTYLHRAPSGSEIASLSNMATEQAEAFVLASNEYFVRRGGGTNQGFVTALYQDILGRPADPQAATLLTQQIGAGFSRAVIAQQVLGSVEARERSVNALYMKYLHRVASTLVPGTHDQVVANIIGSDEYCRQ